MTNKERYKQAFRALHASGEIDLEAEMKHETRHTLAIGKRAVTALICAALLLGLSVTAYAYSEEIRRFFGWKGNAVITQSVGEDGGVIASTEMNTEELTSPVEIKDARMFLVVNGEHTDITDEVKSGKAYVYRYVDTEGAEDVERILLIGLCGEELESYGYAEFIRTTQGEWLGGYSHGIEIGEDMRGPEWFETGKDEMGIPW